VVLMSLAGDKNNIAGFSHSQGFADGGFTVENNFVALAAHAAHADFNIQSDAFRIFAARIIGGHDDGVAKLRGGLTHERPLRTISVSAASEHSNQPTGFK